MPEAHGFKDKMLRAGEMGLVDSELAALTPVELLTKLADPEVRKLDKLAAGLALLRNAAPSFVKGIDF